MSPSADIPVKPIRNRRHIGHADYLIVESLYGIPTNVLDRAQDLAMQLKELFLEHKVLVADIQVGAEKNLKEDA